MSALKQAGFVVVKNEDYTPEALGLFARMEAEPVRYRKNAIDTLIRELLLAANWGEKGAAWGRLSTLGLGLAAANESDSYLDWRRPLAYSKVGATTWAAADGWIGTNSSNNYIDTQWSPDSDSNFTLTDAGLFAYLPSAYPAGSSTICGTSDASSAGATRLNVTTGQIQATVNTSDNAQIDTAPTAGLIFGTREGTQTKAFLDGEIGRVVRTSTATVRATRSMKLFVYDNNGSRSQPFNSSIGVFGAGTSFTAAEQSTFKQLLAGYFDALGYG